MTGVVDRRGELADFLRSRRGRLRPQDVGVPSTGRRRVEGLRRDETARLAGMSVEYYTRLEQGRGGRPSDGVLVSLARALRLDPAERDHLFRLAAPPVGGGAEVATAPGDGGLRPGIAALLAAMPRTPVVAYNRRMDTLAANRLGARLFGDPVGDRDAQRNCARATFLDPAMRHFYVDWEDVARDVVGLLRRFTGQFPHDRGLATLVAELDERSEAFRNLWASQHVRLALHGRKRMRHPVVGDIVLDYEHLSVPDDPDVGLTVYTAPAGGQTQDALDRLAAGADGGDPALSTGR